MANECDFCKPSHECYFQTHPAFARAHAGDGCFSSRTRHVLSQTVNPATPRARGFSSRVTPAASASGAKPKRAALVRAARFQCRLLRRLRVCVDAQSVSELDKL